MADLVELIQQHLAWYPLMELRDVYKLIYQGVLGPEHLVSSPLEFTTALQAELGHLPPGYSSRLIEPVRPDQALLRLNLRPYKRTRQPVDQLAVLCLETAAMQWGEAQDLRQAWDVFARQVRQGGFSQFTPAQVDEFTAWLKGKGYPALHHSQAYRQSYQPAYRLVSKQLYEQLKISPSA